MSGARPVLGELDDEGALEGLAVPQTAAAAVKLEGHASRRRFYRLLTAGGEPQGALLVVYPTGQEDEVVRYRDAARWFRAAGVRVPTIHDRGRRALLVSDGGPDLLDIAPGEPRARRRLYRQAVDVVGRIQHHGRRVPGPNPAMALDRERLYRELLFFEEHAVRGWLAVREGASRREPLYERLADAVAALPVAACHRDYHSRNLLTGGGRLVVLDFQDVMYGPFLYDVVSLIRDDYCDVPADLGGELLHRFWTRCGRPLEVSGEAAVADRPRGLPAAARQAFCLVSLQRSLKALGTFGYQVTVAGNREYARAAPRTRGHALHALELLGWSPADSGLAFLA